MLKQDRQLILNVSSLWLNWTINGCFKITKNTTKRFHLFWGYDQSIKTCSQLDGFFTAFLPMVWCHATRVCVVCWGYSSLSLSPSLFPTLLLFTGWLSLPLSSALSLYSLSVSLHLSPFLSPPLLLPLSFSFSPLVSWSLGSSCVTEGRESTAVHWENHRSHTH